MPTPLEEEKPIVQLLEKKVEPIKKPIDEKERIKMLIANILDKKHS